MQGAPMRHRGEHVGHFFVGDWADGEGFTEEDEEILVLFASQAAAAIANARSRRVVEWARDTWCPTTGCWARCGAGAVQTCVKKLCRRLGDAAASPAYILTERGVGCRMPADPA
jgi:hypothetical protein